MNIEVAVSKSATTKDKGDLLEELAMHLLRAQNYEVEREVRKTGVELDLLCKHKANNNKKLYVECKAYKDDNNINAGIIVKLLGAMQLEECEEAWIICTCELGKDAKGVVDKLTSKGRTDITIYTPSKFITVLVDANVIKSEDIANHSISKILNRNLYQDSTLLVTPVGIYWTYRKKKEKTDTRVFVVDAKTGDIVVDSDILSKLSTFDSTMCGFEFCALIPASISTTNGKGVVEYKFRLDDEYVQSIKDTGVMYTHPHKRVLDKDDLFIFPDLQLVNEDDKISSAELMSFDEKYRKNIIFGDELSGKTTLAQKLQRIYVESGNIPVYINACDINFSNLEKFHKILRRQIKLQYANVTDEIVGTIDKSKIIIFIDDFHNTTLNKDAASQLFLAIDKEYESIIWLMNTKQELELLANDKLVSELAEYNLYRIKELGFKLRDEMIKTWISIGRVDTIYESDKHNQVMEIAEIINSTIGYNYVPTYPIYVLTLLQSFEASTVKSLQGSAYAEFYNYLITHALGTAGVKAAELNLYYSLLSELSHYFFVGSEKEISESNTRKFYEEFCNRKMLDRKFDKTKKILIQSKILKSENDSYRFNHSYIYYFFVGKYLSDNAQKNVDIQQKITDLTKRLYLRECANIVIFLVHFSKDQFVLDNILLEAKKIFTEISLATFAEDEFANINRLVEAELRIILEDKRPEETRAKQLEIKDSLNENLPKEPTNETDYNSDIKELDVYRL
ncbi:restriction endonuclease [Thioflexithrix psekupsensis]|uniref:Uncharacterized protein n=1 Tax=Thioflexithrix psekupsensis TaxID=1570016 RepID=A0A251X8W4_9GAMM|nr:restriction endonuclease [Thioflexithrix psekupsensis]OUD14375.1 hypothetical protein TPSD3_08650 [Thioflexithrix psekupsensis]